MRGEEIIKLLRDNLINCDNVRASNVWHLDAYLRRLERKGYEEGYQAATMKMRENINGIFKDMI